MTSSTYISKILNIVKIQNSRDAQEVSWILYQVWTNCAPDTDRVHSGVQNPWGVHILPWKKEKTLDLQIFDGRDKTMQKLLGIPDNIVITRILVIFWLCQNWYIYSWILKHLMNLEPLQTHMMYFFTKIVSNVNLKPLIIFAKKSILDAWRGPECASSSRCNTVLKF